MNGPGDLPLQHYSSTPDANNCSIISIIPNLGMSSCRGRAEAFARRLSSKLRTLGSQTDETDNSQEDEPIINGGGTPNNTWVTGQESEQAVTDLQPLRHESDSFFDFDCELESPGSPVDECEYLRLIESTSNTPHNSAPESGYACASAASSHSSSDGPYFDIISESESSQQQQPVPKHKKLSHLSQQPRTAQPHLSESDEVDCAKPPTSAIAKLCNGHDSPLAVKEFSQTSESQQHISKNVTKSLPSEGPDIEETQKPKSQNPSEPITLEPKSQNADVQICNIKSQSSESKVIEHKSQLPEPLILEPQVQNPEPIVLEHKLQQTEPIIRQLKSQNRETITLGPKSPNPESILKQNCRAPTLQEQILKELQRQSQDITDEELEGEKNKKNLTAEAAIQKEPELDAEPSVTAIDDTIYKVIHTLINGHAENGEDVLQIEVCELEQLQEEKTQAKENLNTEEPKIKQLAVSTKGATEEPKSQEVTVNTKLSTGLTAEETKPQEITVITKLITELTTEEPKIQELTVSTKLVSTELITEEPKIQELTVNTKQSTELTTEESKSQEPTATTKLSTKLPTEEPKSQHLPELSPEQLKSQQLTVNTQLSTELSPEEPQSPEFTTNTQLSTALEQAIPKTQHVGLHHDTTDDEDDCRPQRVRRCSSLKTGKTPPGTPGRKKIVRFADVLGLDLADIKTFLDEIPTVPKSAYEDLEYLESEPPIQLGPKSNKLLMPLFQQPASLATFLDTVRAKQVSLENAAVSDTINHTITGSVRVRNLDFHKSVHIRYSLDGWRSYADLQANYVQNSCDGFSDIFTFVLFGNSLHVGQRLEFAVRFQCKGQQYWDNNHGANYCFQCLPTSTIPAPVQLLPSHHANNMVGILSPTAGEAWCSSFY